MAEISGEGNITEEILTEMEKHNIIGKIIEELSKIIEEKKYEFSLSRN